MAGADAGLVDAIAAAADPDLALTALARLPGEAALQAALRADHGLRDRLIAVLGTSAALGEHLVRHPGQWRVLAGPEALAAAEPGELRAELLAAAGADGSQGDPVTALRVAYRGRLLHLAARDLTGAMTLGETAAELADLAAAALEAALAIARARLEREASRCRLAVIAMGKCGGRELNYASDVDVIFVAAPAGGASEDAALRAATQLAAAMIGVCSQPAAEGPLFPVDANLRPEGRDGPLVRTLASHRCVLRALGQDLGVPGAAQGQAGGGRRRAWP